MQSIWRLKIRFLTIGPLEHEYAIQLNANGAYDWRSLSGATRGPINPIYSYLPVAWRGLPAPEKNWEIARLTCLQNALTCVSYYPVFPSSLQWKYLQFFCVNCICYANLFYYLIFHYYLLFIFSIFEILHPKNFAPLPLPHATPLITPKKKQMKKEQEQDKRKEMIGRKRRDWISRCWIQTDTYAVPSHFHPFSIQSCVVWPLTDSSFFPTTCLAM